MEIVVGLAFLEAAMTGPDCVRLPGWTVIGVAALLTAPRLVDRYLEG